MPRRTPVQYDEVDGALLLLASAGGAPRPPQWWLNLQADPHVTVSVRGVRRDAVARTLEGHERERAWRALCAAHPRLAVLEARAGRELPIVSMPAG